MKFSRSVAPNAALKIPPVLVPSAPPPKASVPLFTSSTPPTALLKDITVPVSVEVAAPADFRKRPALLIVNASLPLPTIPPSLARS